MSEHRHFELLDHPTKFFQLFLASPADGRVLLQLSKRRQKRRQSASAFLVFWRIQSRSFSTNQHSLQIPGDMLKLDERNFSKKVFRQKSLQFGHHDILNRRVLPWHLELLQICKLRRTTDSRASNLVATPHDLLARTKDCVDTFQEGRGNSAKPLPRLFDFCGESRLCQLLQWLLWQKMPSKILVRIALKLIDCREILDYRLQPC